MQMPIMANSVFIAALIASTAVGVKRRSAVVPMQHQRNEVLNLLQDSHRAMAAVSWNMISSESVPSY